VIDHPDFDEAVAAIHRRVLRAKLMLTLKVFAASIALGALMALVAVLVEPNVLEKL
jgi:hypothetical protein